MQKCFGGTRKSEGGTQKCDSGSQKYEGGSQKCDSGTQKCEGGTRKCDSGIQKCEGGRLPRISGYRRTILVGDLMDWQNEVACPLLFFLKKAEVYTPIHPFLYKLRHR